MAKGASIKFKSYKETVPKLLNILNLGRELKKYGKIVLKPSLTNPPEESTSAEFVESILKFVLENKNPVAEVFIAEGAEGCETEQLFDSLGYRRLAENYDVGLVDLNNTEVEEIEKPEFHKFSEILYPAVLLDSFVISLPKLLENEETGISGALSNMLGAFSSSFYSGFFSKNKSKIRRWPIKYSIHDIVQCKMPDFAVIDASSHGSILAGLPLEIDKQSAKIIGKEWKLVPYISLLDETSLDGKT